MLDKNATIPATNLQETLDLISCFLADAFNYGKKAYLTPEIHDDYLPGESFNLAIRLGWIAQPPRLESGVYLGGYVVSQQYYEEFKSFLPWSWGYAQHFRERFDPESIMEWAQPTPDQWLQTFKVESELTEEEIAERVGCHEKTLQRFKVPGYRTQIVIVKALAEFMKQKCPQNFGDFDFHQLMWRQRED